MTSTMDIEEYELNQAQVNNLPMLREELKAAKKEVLA
jgi:hypothetical protein